MNTALLVPLIKTFSTSIRQITTGATALSWNATTALRIWVPYAICSLVDPLMYCQNCPKVMTLSGPLM